MKVNLPDPKTIITFLRLICKLVSAVLNVVKIALLPWFTFRLITFDKEEVEKCLIAQITRNYLFSQWSPLPNNFVPSQGFQKLKIWKFIFLSIKIETNFSTLVIIPTIEKLFGWKNFSFYKVSEYILVFPSALISTELGRVEFEKRRNFLDIPKHNKYSENK